MNVASWSERQNLGGTLVRKPVQHEPYPFRPSGEGLMPTELVPNAGGPDVLPNPVPAPDPEPPEPDPIPEPSPVPPLPEPAPAFSQRKTKAPQTSVESSGTLLRTAPPPGVAHLSDAFGAEVVAWIPRLWRPLARRLFLKRQPLASSVIQNAVQWSLHGRPSN
jgi:hypothetical protein